MEYPEYWCIWARTLQQKQLTGLAISLLEGFDPARLLISQVMLSVVPFLGQGGLSNFYSFACILEDKEKSRSFASFLREEKPL
jgi:hypothetical protein